MMRSIGSLGKNLKEDGVQNVTVRSATFKGTQNGLRIKSWGQPSSGFARNIVFQHAVMSNVQNPIIINQHYCPDHEGCPRKVIIFTPKYVHEFFYFFEKIL